MTEEQVAYRVHYRVMKNRYGCFENGGYSDFRTWDEADAFIDKFKETHDGWTSEIDEPEEIPLDEAELDQ